MPGAQANQWQFFPERASALAEDVDALFYFVSGVTGFFGLLIAALVIAFAIKFRRRSEAEQPKPMLGSLRLEIAWSIVPLVIVLVFFAWGAKIFAQAYSSPEGAMEIFVTGKQWMWKVQHPSGKREINQLHVPKGQSIKLTMTSEDVIHSFYVPAFRLKRDVVPGMYTAMSFTPTKVGEYHLFCAEYCGTEHSGMKGTVTVMEPHDYEAWLADAPVPGAGSMAEKGEQLFGSLACTGCHDVTKRSIGPAVGGLFGRQVQLQTGEVVEADESYVRESILEPLAKVVAGFPPVMPTYAGQVTDDELNQLIAYLKSLEGETALQEAVEPEEPAQP